MSVPGYWMNESSGLLANAVRRYLNGDDLGEVDMPLMRAYLSMWVNAPGWAGDLTELRRDAETLATTADVRDWLDRALDLGIDPL